MKELKNSILNIAKSTGANKSKVPTEVLSELLYYRLVIARLGEEDNNAWWESNVLSEVGRRNVNRFLPNTFAKQRYDMARKIIYTKETRSIDNRKFLSIYNFSYKFESEVFKPFVDEMAISEEWPTILSILENIKSVKFSSPWVREYFDMDKLPSVNLKDTTTVEVGSIHENFYNEYSEFITVIKGLLSIYDCCTFGKLIIPYYTRKVAI
ncbi:BrxE family protein [Ruminiclostridium cellobioparum]|uniref:BrxE family protein n=1 Tax=Ruminiclostridium cellobioparum TaxID=29355 RepID=UPI0028AEFD37|nr:BrxE family protein [Ruminiclostridium cellobioparum]